MHRIARKYRVKFAEGVTYHHPEYTGNYSKAFEDKQRLQDAGIVYFQILDEIRKAAREDSGYRESLDLHWQARQRVILQILAGFEPFQNLVDRVAANRDRIREMEEELKRARSRHPSLFLALRTWWAARRRRKR
jgi:hypothetical protein